jgi:hypothetical protein
MPGLFICHLYQSIEAEWANSGSCFQALIDRILLDGEVSKKALDDPRLNHYARDEFLKPQVLV